MHLVSSQNLTSKYDYDDADDYDVCMHLAGPQALTSKHINSDADADICPCVQSMPVLEAALFAHVPAEDLHRLLVGESHQGLDPFSSGRVL